MKRLINPDQNGKYESSELSDLSEYKENDENQILLDSFDTSELDEVDKDKMRSQGSLSDKSSDASSEQEEDTRLEDARDGDGLLGTAEEIDRNIHEAMISEGNSSNSNSRDGNSNDNDNTGENTDNDLELQIPGGRLTTRERVVNVLNSVFPIKRTYERINNGLTTGRMQTNLPGRFIGQGTDGVFRNLMAKPDREANRFEETHPPSYEEAAADATPEYWESTVVSPLYEDEVFVEGLPVGNVANLVWNILVSSAFQFVGFVLCYLLHTSHAAKQGSRAGLGITFVYYGYGMIPSNFGSAEKVPDRYEPNNPNQIDIDESASINDGKLDNYKSGIFQQHKDSPDTKLNQTPYFAYGIIAFGIFIILKAFVDYYRVKQMERVILSPPSNETVVTNSVTENTGNYGEV
mmetsp:Transcript_2707/g.3011  ORF Transcript_2707/g.3011 Transcript_2707/m.3011 type:complete len:406 (-) Transcript_2707:1165-2382(-)